MKTIPDENNPKLVRAVCDSCGKANPSACRPSKIDASVQYLICPACNKKQDYPKGSFENGETTWMTFQAAPGDWWGVTIRETTPEEYESGMRARRILKIGLAKWN